MHYFKTLLLNLLERSDEPERRQMLVQRMREAVTRGSTLT
jgi:hypothetical protein